LTKQVKGMTTVAGRQATSVRSPTTLAHIYKLLARIGFCLTQRIAPERQQQRREQGGNSSASAASRIINFTSVSE